MHQLARSQGPRPRDQRKRCAGLVVRELASLGSGQLRVFADTDIDRKQLANCTASVRLEVSNMSLNQLKLNIEPLI
jgi:hypothetical protein